MNAIDIHDSIEESVADHCAMMPQHVSDLRLALLPTMPTLLKQYTPHVITYIMFEVSATSHRSRDIRISAVSMIADQSLTVMKIQRFMSTQQTSVFTAYRVCRCMILTPIRDSCVKSEMSRLQIVDACHKYLVCKYLHYYEDDFSTDQR